MSTDDFYENREHRHRELGGKKPHPTIILRKPSEKVKSNSEPLSRIFPALFSDAPSMRTRLCST
jgi:hypothetical protein